MSYTANDLILDIEASYSEFSVRLKENYRKEFEDYSTNELLKVRDAILDNHEFNKAPVLAKVFKYMRESGIARKSSVQVSWFRCGTCGADYPIKTAICPVCAYRGEIKNNDHTVIFGMEYPSKLRRVNQHCLRCNEFVGKKVTPRGATCDAFWSFNHEKKANKECDGCPCYSCCNEQPYKGNKIKINTKRFKDE